MEALGPRTVPNEGELPSSGLEEVVALRRLARPDVFSYWPNRKPKRGGESGFPKLICDL